MKTKKKVLVDLSYLKDVYRGYGQIALNYGKYFKENYRASTAPYELTLLVPDNMAGKFGNEVKYISSSNWFNKRFRFLFPTFDIWHNLQYPSRFRPHYFAKSTKYIFTLHDLNCLTLEYEKTLRNIEKNRRSITRHINRASVVVAVSRFAKDQIESIFDLRGKQSLMIYNGVENIVNNVVRKPDADIRSPFFFSISAFRPTKNFHVLLDMMKLLPDKHLYMAGNDNTAYGRLVRGRIANEGIHNVHLLGKVSEEQKTWLYKNCEAFLFPSLFEGFGLPVIEAMQFGKPVFSSKKTSLREIGGNFAYFWDSFAPQDMKMILDKYLDEFYRDNTRAFAAKEYAQSFSYARHFEEYEKLYAQL